MQPREIEFIVGVETSTTPAAGTPSVSTDLITFGYLTGAYSPKKRVTGTLAAPYEPAGAGTALAHGLLSTEDECFMFIQAATETILDLSNNPQIAAGTKVGQRLIMFFTSATKQIKFETGNGLVMYQGDTIVTTIGTRLEWHWDGTNWQLTDWNFVGDQG